MKLKVVRQISVNELTMYDLFQEDCYNNIYVVTDITDKGVVAIDINTKDKTLWFCAIEAYCPVLLLLNY